MGWRDDAKTVWDGFCTDPRNAGTKIPHIHEGDNGTWCRECGKPHWDEIHHPLGVAMQDNGAGSIKRNLRIGGVMRCCIETLRQYQAEGGPEPIGQILKCKWGTQKLIVAPDGVWEWLDDDE